MSTGFDLEVRWDSGRRAWVVQARGNSHKPFDVCRTKALAVRSAAQLATMFVIRDGEGSSREVYIYRRFGNRSRWVDRRTYGHDPRASRG